MALYILAPDPNGQCCDCATRPNPCDTCGEAEQGCALFIPSPVDQYASLAEAQADIAGDTPYLRITCYGYYDSDSGSTITDFTTTPGDNSLTITAAANNTNSAGFIWVSVSVSEGATLRINANGYINNLPVVDPTFTTQLYSADPFTLIDQTTINSLSGTIDFSDLTEGTYYLAMRSNGLPAAIVNAGFNSLVVSTTTGSMVANPSVLRYNDSGTTRNLYACPKFQIPLFTGQTGTWYADEAAAQSELDNFTSNCIGLIESIPSGASFLATGGVFDVSLECGVYAAGSVVSMWGSLNVPAGVNITVQAGRVVTSSPPVGTWQVSIYDSDYNLLASSGPLDINSVALWDSYESEYTGIYLIKVSGSGSNVVGIDFNLNCVGSVGTVNLIQALYDNNTLCPARLDCS